MQEMGKDALDIWLPTRQKFHADHSKELLEAWSLHLPAAASAGVVVANGGAAPCEDAAPEQNH